VVEQEVRIGARFPNAGDYHGQRSLADAARHLEAAGFDSLWASDHLGMPATSRHPYPFTEDGRIPWGRDLAWTEPLTALAIAAAATERIELGTAIMVAALRHPLIAAKQIAGVALEARGRVAIGVGAGWLAEEFDAVGIPFDKRGRYLDEWIDRARHCLDGTYPPADADASYPNPAELWVRPCPPRPVPILIGGMGRRAVRRAALSGEGWIAVLHASSMEVETLRPGIAQLRQLAAEAGRRRPRVVVQVLGSAGASAKVGQYLPALASVGVDDVIIDVGFDEDTPPEAALAALRT
jgi:probable F420-dependent oxidoreductase